MNCNKLPSKIGCSFSIQGKVVSCADFEVHRNASVCFELEGIVPRSGCVISSGDSGHERISSVYLGGGQAGPWRYRKLRRNADGYDSPW